jgi:hypothetical protein
MSDREPGPASDPEPGDHYRANGDGPVPTGYYRVVGRDSEGVTLLHVGDGEGRRRHTGRVESVDRSRLDALDDAEAPEAGVRAGLTGFFERLWLPVRLIPGNLRDRPGQALLGAALLASAVAGPALLDLPSVVFAASNLLGALLLGAAAAGLPR